MRLIFFYIFVQQGLLMYWLNITKQLLVFTLFLSDSVSNLYVIFGSIINITNISVGNTMCILLFVCSHCFIQNALIDS